MYSRYLSFLIVAGLLLLTACDTSTAPEVTPENDLATPLDLHESIPASSADAKFLSIEKEVPGFAGVFNEGNGVLRAYVKGDAAKSTDPGLIRSAVEAQMGDLSALTRSRGDKSVGTPTLEVTRADYSFSELSEIRVRGLDALKLKGIHTIDVDERANRVRIQADGEFAMLEAKRFAESNGLSLDAIIIEDAPMPERMATLRDRIRPLKGGLQIAFDNNLCTLGFVANRSGVRGFMTNAHCSSNMFSVAPTYYYQPSRTSGNYIGYETVDPALSGGTRYSDAAFVRITSGVSSSLGRIARTSGWAFQTGSGSLTINGELEIDSEDCTVTTGDLIDKIGRTTGWTYGEVESTCQSINMGSYTLLCQDEVYAGVNGGDSGSATFRWKGDTDGDGLDNVDLTGLLWGGRTYPSGKKTFLYSPMCQVETDIGSLQTF